MNDAVQFLQEGDDTIKKKLVSQERRILHTFIPKPLASLEIEKGVKPATYAPKETEPTMVAEEPPKQTTPEPTPPKKKTTKPVGLAGLRNVKDKIREQIQEEEQSKEPVALTFENVQEPLQNLYNQLGEQKMFYKSSILNSYHELVGNKLTIHTPMLSRALFEDYKMTMKAALAAHFHNEDFELYLEEIPEVDNGEKIQSKREIFDELAEKNQHLLTLRDKFGFDIIP